MKLVALFLLCAVTGAFGIDCDDGYLCDKETKCISHKHICNCKTDCDDGSDEGFDLCGTNDSPNKRDCATCSMNTVNDLKELLVVTWDRADIYYKGMTECRFVLAESQPTSRLPIGFKVIAKVKAERGIKYIEGILIELIHATHGVTRIYLGELGQVMYNGHPLDVDKLTKKNFEVPGHKNIHIGHRQQVKTTLVDFDGVMRFMYRTEGSRDKHHLNLLCFNKEFMSDVDGLCGNYNALRSDDFFAKGGNTLVANQDEILNSWTLENCPYP